MLNETTKNFLQVMADFKWPDPVPINYRLYYNDDGSPDFYTMEDLPGKYVEVDRDTYVARLWNVRVKQGKLQIIAPVVTVKKLRPSPIQGTTCHPQDICVVVTQDNPNIKWHVTIHETN